MFQTLPLIFSEISGGYFLALLFFALLVLAALTSQISAMEPLIAYFIDSKRWSRRRASFVTTLLVGLLSIPCMLSFGILRGEILFGKNFFNLLLFLCLNILIPLGGLAAALLVGWKWPFKRAAPHLEEGAESLFAKCPFLKGYFNVSIRYLAPLLIVIVFLDLLGLFR